LKSIRLQSLQLLSNPLPHKNEYLVKLNTRDEDEASGKIKTALMVKSLVQ